MAGGGIMMRRIDEGQAEYKKMVDDVSPIDFVFALLCDDVRTEVTGKEIIIGVYSGNIMASSFPANMLLCIWAQYMPKRVGDVEIELRIVGPNSAQLAHMAAGLAIGKVQYSSLHTPQLPIQVQTPGDLSIQARVKGSEWRTLRVVPVEVLRDGAPGLPASVAAGKGGAGERSVGATAPA